MARSLLADALELHAELEEIQLDEISKKLGKRYADKALGSLRHHDYQAGYYEDDDEEDTVDHHIRKSQNREKGLGRVADKLGKPGAKKHIKDVGYHNSQGGYEVGRHDDPDADGAQDSFKRGNKAEHAARKELGLKKKKIEGHGDPVAKRFLSRFRGR